MPQIRFSPISLYLAATIAIAGVTAVALVFVKQAYDEFGWKRVYDQVHIFGTECNVAVGTWPGSFAKAWAQTHSLRPQVLPYRGTPNPPKVAADGYILSDCPIKMPTFAQSDYPFLSLGFVFGHSQVMVGDKLVVESYDDGIIEFPLDPATRQSPFLHVKVLSQRTEKANPGMASLLPMFVATNREAPEIIRRNFAAFSGERPLYRLAVAGVLSAFFILLWISGLRFLDVQWIAAMAAVVALQNFTTYARSFGHNPSLLYRFESVFNFGFGITCVLFFLNVLRLSAFASERLQRVKYMPVLCILGGAISIIFLPEQLFFDMRLLTRAPTLVTIGLLVASLVWAGWRLSQETLQSAALAGAIRLRNIRFCTLTALTVIVCTLEIYCEDKLAISLRPYSQFLMLGLYASMLLIDLARRQTEYFVELELRQAREREAVEAMALANAAQMLAHDIRRPFNSMRLIHDRILGPNRASDAVAILESLLPDVLRQQVRVDGLITELMSVGQEIRLETETFAIDSCLAAALSTCGAVPKAIGLNLKYEVLPCTVIGDRLRTQRVLENIIENAIHAVDEGGTLTFFVTRQQSGANGDVVKIGVRNSGSFIEPRIRERVFDFAFTSGKATGTGLGLAIARRIVNAQGGKIWCESTSDAGTTFWITLPYGELAEPTTLPSQLGGEAHLFLAAHRASIDLTDKLDATSFVCLVDDDPLQILGWKMTITDAALVTFVSPAALLAELAKGGPKPWPQIFVLDFEFPGWDGTGGDLANAIKAVRPDARIAICSNRRLSYVNASVEAVLDKAPRTFAELKQAIENYRKPLVS